MDHLLSQLSDTVDQARSLEDLTRPLLELLSGITGMESTYLTTIDLEAGIQQVQYARNASAMVIPEGLAVPWADTLCRRALQEDCLYTDDVAQRWGDSDAARALGIHTYASAPVKDQEGQLLGTLCAASAHAMPAGFQARDTLVLFSRLIAVFMERETLLEKLRSNNERLSQLALSDPLTGLPNRRAVLAALPRMLAQAQRSRSFVLAAMIDLDGFKAVNDTHGHQAGDEFLREIGVRLAKSIRGVDLAGRIGGDEFLVLGPGPAGSETGHTPAVSGMAARTFQRRLVDATTGVFELPSVRLDYGGASVGVAVIPSDTVDYEGALRLADEEMYRVKRERKGLR